MKHSRLSRRIEKQTRKTIFFSIFGILIVFFIFIKLGIPILVNFSLFISSSKQNQTNQEGKNTNTFVATPVINLPFNATNSATISITGTGQPKQTISLYLNDNLIAKTAVLKDRTFTFSDIKLDKGENNFKAKSLIENEGESEFSEMVSITYKDKKPNLTVDSLTDGQAFKKDDKTAEIKGKTDSGVKIIVNGFWAIVDENGNYSYQLPLQNGDNQIKIVASDDAGNTTEKELKVTYSP